MIRYLLLLLLWGVLFPAWSQPVLTITDARKSTLIAPYRYILEDFSGNLTYQKVLQMPQDSFRLLSKVGITGLLNSPKAIWLRLGLKNKTSHELFLLSQQPSYQRLDVYVLDEAGKLSVYQVGNRQPMTNRVAPIAHPLISLGHHPQLVHMAMYPNDIFRDHMEIVDIGKSIQYQKRRGFWQGIVLGTYLLLLVYAVTFGIRLRFPILGWYALFLFTNMHWFLHRSGYFNEFLGNESLYAQFIQYYSPRFIFVLCWAVFHIKFLHLKRSSLLLYCLLAGWVGMDVINHFCIAASQLFGAPFAPLDIVLSWMGIDWAFKLIITLALMLISVIYVSRKNFREVHLYALGLGVGITAMLISMFAL